MLRGTVRKVHALGDVSVTIDGRYGAKSLIRMKSRVPVDVGERVFVEDVSPLPDRAHDWVLFGKLTEIGEWATPAPHTHPIGQVIGLVDWLTKYETWMGDHEKRMVDAEALIKAGTDAVADTRAVLAETRTDLADAVKRVAVQEVFADKASARLDQAERDIRAGGDRIGATEAAIRSANDSLESAKTVIQKTQADLADGSGLAQKVAKFLTVSAMTGVFTKSLTAADAKLLGQTVADSFTANKVAARDIIATGTVDLAQLNVTGPMSASIIKASDISARRAFFTEGLTAENATLLGQTVADNLVVSDTFAARVVNAMSTNTKRLVVTDDAILNRATIVQSLVTPELIAAKVDARYLRADAISTANLEVLGRFRTAPMGQPQIIIQPSQSAWNNKDLAIWWTPDGTTPGAGNASAPGVAGGIWMNPISDTGEGWEGRTLNLRGQSRAGVSISDGLIIQATDKATGCSILSSPGQLLNIIGRNGVRIRGNNGPSMIDAAKSLDIACMDGRALLLGKTVEVVANDSLKLFSTNGDINMETGNNNEARIHVGPAGFRVTSKNGNTWSYDITTSTAANLNIDGNGKIFRVTSSRRYKKYISDAPINAEKIMGLRLRKWRDRVQEGMPEDLRYHYGAIAEEVADIFPEFVPTIPDPSVTDANGEPDPDAPLVPDSIEYDRLGLFVAVTGYQDLRPRVDLLEKRLAILEGK